MGVRGLTVVIVLKPKCFNCLTPFVVICIFRIFVGSWNVNGQYPAEDVTPWLAVYKDPPDVFCLG